MKRFRSFLYVLIFIGSIPRRLWRMFFGGFSSTIPRCLRRGCLFTLLIFQLLLPFPLFADAVGKINEIRGSVNIERAKTFLKARVEDAVQPKDFISTGDKSRARLLLIDDSIVSVGRNTKLEVTEFLLDKNKRTSVISLKSGAIHTRVEKFLDPDSKFEIHTPTAVAGARGTAWLTVVEIVNNVVEVTVFAIDQAVAVFNPAFPGQVVIVPAGYSTTIVAGFAPTAPIMIDPSYVEGLMSQWNLSELTTGGGAANAGLGGGTITEGGIQGGTVAAGLVGVTAIAAGIASASSGGGSTTTTTRH